MSVSLQNRINIGLQYEKPLLDAFKERHNNLVLKRPTKCTVIKINTDLPRISFRCDGLIGNDGIVEVKCLERNVNFDANINDHLHYMEFRDNHVTLKPKSRYYDQIQLYLLLSRRKHCYFVIGTRTNPGLFEQKIPASEEHMASLKQRIR